MNRCIIGLVLSILLTTSVRSDHFNATPSLQPDQGLDATEATVENVFSEEPPSTEAQFDAVNETVVAKNVDLKVSDNILSLVRDGNFAGRHSRVHASNKTTRREIWPPFQTDGSKRDDDADITGLAKYLPLDRQRMERAIDAMNGRVCKEHCRRTIDAFQRQEQWALKMYDAAVKQPQGIFVGTLYHLGNFDECVQVESLAGHLPEPVFRGQYCLADVELEPPGDHRHSGEATHAMRRSYQERSDAGNKLHWAVCVPSTCSRDDVQILLSSLFAELTTDSSEVNVTVPPRMCYTRKDVPASTIDIVYGCVVLAFLLIILVGTIYHLIQIYSRAHRKEEKSVLHEVILCFSIVHNMKKIFAYKQSNGLNLDFVSGMRGLAMAFIIGGHSLIITAIGPVLNQHFFSDGAKDLENALFVNNPLVVDTFLVFSGFLMCLMLMIELDKRKGRINFLILYVGRYVRLTPAYSVVLGFYATWMVRISDGPLWNNRMTLEKNRCRESWWANLLYINNYVSTDNLCMFQSWYLSVDTQLFMIAPFIIYSLWKWPRFGHAVLGLSTIGSVAVPFVVTFVNNLDPTLMAFIPELTDFQFNDYFMNAYVKTHMRASAYCFGLLCGYLIYRIENAKYTIPKVAVFVFWILASLVGLVSMFSITFIYRRETALDRLSSAMYSALHRAGWCAAMVWLIIACITDNAGPIKQMLSWSFFQPMARLTYCAYLVNGLVVLYAYGVERTIVHLSIFNLFCRVAAHVLISFGLAIGLCAMFESPIHGIERILLRGERKRPKSEKREINPEV